MKKMLALATALMLLAAPGLAQEEEVARLQAQIEELEAENAELRELLSQEASARLVAARFNGGVITVSEAKEEYAARASFYEDAELDLDEYEDVIKESVLEDLTQEAVLRLKAQELGVYEPDEEEAAQIRARAQESFEEMIEYYLPYQSDPARSDEENRAAVEMYLAAEGTTLEGMIETLTAQGWSDRLYEAATADLDLEGEDLRAYFDTALASAQMNYATNPQAYEADRMNGEVVLFNPEGYRRVKRILIAFDEAAEQSMTSLLAQMEQATAQEEITSLLAQMDALYEQLDETAQEVRAHLDAGEDFDALIEEYGSDPYMQTEQGREEGYYVSAASTLLDASFVAEAMALTEPGEIAGPFECTDGLYFVRYEGDVPSGGVSYEEMLADEEMRSDIAESARRSYYNELVQTWLEEAQIETYPENF